jgi:hypothetical protein
MNLELSQRERAIGLGLCAIVVALAILACTAILRARRALVTQADALRSQLSATTSERDTRANQIAPFAILAEQQFPSDPPEQRLSLLFRRIESITDAMSRMRGRRQLDSEAMARIREKLDLAPGLDIEVGAIWQDAEALALAGELRTVFEGAGFKPRKLAQYVPPPDFPSGVAVFSRHDLDQVLSDAISQIFTEINQAPIQWLDEDLVSSAKPSEPQPELKIIVSHQ